MSDPHEWHVAQDDEGFFIENEYGEEIAPPWMVRVFGRDEARWRGSSYDVAKKVLDETVQHAIDNYDGGEP